MLFVSSGEMQQQEDCKPGCIGRIPAAPDLEHPTRGPGRHVHQRQTIREFLDELQLLPSDATKNRRRRPGCCVASYTAHPPVPYWRRPTRYAAPCDGLSTALRAPRCRASVVRHPKFWFVQAGFSQFSFVWRQRCITRRSPLGKGPAIHTGCGPFGHAKCGILLRFHMFFVGRLRQD